MAKEQFGIGDSIEFTVKRGNGKVEEVKNSNRKKKIVVELDRNITDRDRVIFLCITNDRKVSILIPIVYKNIATYIGEVDDRCVSIIPVIIGDNKFIYGEKVDIKGV